MLRVGFCLILPQISRDQVKGEILRRELGRKGIKNCMEATYNKLERFQEEKEDWVSKKVGAVLEGEPSLWRPFTKP